MSQLDIESFFILCDWFVFFVIVVLFCVARSLRTQVQQTQTIMASICARSTTTTNAKPKGEKLETAPPIQTMMSCQAAICRLATSLQVFASVEKQN